MVQYGLGAEPLPPSQLTFVCTPSRYDGGLALTVPDVHDCVRLGFICGLQSPIHTMAYNYGPKPFFLVLAG